MDFTAFLWLVSLIPLFILFSLLLILKWPAYRAGALSLLMAATIGFIFFKADIYLLALACSKGLSFGMFFLSFIWAAVIFYNIVLAKTGIDTVIGCKISGLVQDRLMLALLLSWCLSGFFEGIVGFGVPVIIIAPFLVAVGFAPFTAVAMTLVGHSWAVSYGPLGLAYYTLQLITRLPPDSLKLWLSVMMFAPIILSGMAVAHIYGGRKALKKVFPLILLVGLIMSSSYMLLPQLGGETLTSLLSGLSGAMGLVLIQRVFCPRQNKDVGVHLSDDQKEKGSALTIGRAIFPFGLLIFFVLFFQIPLIQEILAPFKWALSYPSASTGLGYQVSTEVGYAPIGLVGHPAPLILLTTVIGGVYFYKIKVISPYIFWRALSEAARQVLSASLTLLTLVITALIMNDTGMSTILAQGVAILTGRLYPIMVPLIGALGCFLTGSNNNSNVLFGIFQKEAALTLGVSTLILVSSHSVGGGLGSSITPAKVLLGTSALGLTGEENSLFRVTVRYCLFIVLVTGILTWVFSYVLFTQVP